MSPNSPLRLGLLGIHLSLYGEWEQGKALPDQAMNQDIGYPLFLHGATTLYYYRTRNYELALEEAGK